MNRKILFAFVAIYSVAAGLGFYLSGGQAQPGDPEIASYILQGKSTDAVIAAVRSVEGEITHEFSTINAVAATLTLEQRDDLLVNPAVLAINEDAPVRAAGGSAAGTFPIVTLEGTEQTIAEL